MTAAELRAIVCDVPSEALGDVRWTTDHENALFFVRGVAGFIPAHVAESAFIGSMTAWLIDQDNSVKSWSPVGEFDGERFRPVSFVAALNEDDLDKAEPHHSLVAALAAACKEAA